MNKLVDQDRRRLKQRLYLMLGFKRVEDAAVTVSGIESAHNIKKGQFIILGLRLEQARAEELWQAFVAG